MDIFTIGHSNYSIDRLIDMLRYFNIDCVVDIRGIPYSKYNVQFDKDTISYITEQLTIQSFGKTKSWKILI